MPNDDIGAGGGSVTAIQELAVDRLFNDVLSQETPEVCALLMATGAITHTPAGDFTGPTGFERYVIEAWSAFPDATFIIDDQASNGNQVAINWTLRGRHLESLGDQPATGALVQLQGLAIVLFEDAMITESWLQYDRLSLVDQIASSQDVPPICPPCELP